MKVLGFIVLIGVASVSCKVTPDYFPQCRKSDPEIEQCILTGIESMRPRLNEGISEVHIPGIDPFNVPTLKLDRTASNLRLKAVLKHMKAYGGSSFRIDKLKLNLQNKYVAEVKMFIPKLFVTGDYDVRGSRLLTLNIDGKGTMKSNFTGISVIARGSAKPIMKDGVEFLQADKVITKVKIAHGQVSFAETERPLAAASAEAFFNASPGVVLEILNPIIEESGATILKKYLNKILGTIPLHEVLIDDVEPKDRV